MSEPVVRTGRRTEFDGDGHMVIFNNVEIKCFRPPQGFLSKDEVDRLAAKYTPLVENGFRRVEAKREWQMYENRILLFVKDVEIKGDVANGH